MSAGRRQTKQDVARSYAFAGELLPALHCAYRKAGEIIVPISIHAGHFGCLATDKSAMSEAASISDPGNDLPSDVRFQFSGGEIIKKEKGFRTLNDKIVDAHGDKVDANTVVDTGFYCELKLGANAIICSNQQWVLVAGCPWIEKPTESTEFRIGARPCRGASQRGDCPNERIARGDGNTCIGIGKGGLGLGCHRRSHSVFNDEGNLHLADAMAVVRTAVVFRASILFGITLLLAASVAHAQTVPKREAPEAAAQAGSAYSVGGIRVDVAAKDPESARFSAYRIAQRKAWPLLYARLTGKGVASAPRLSDGQLDSVVAGIESQGERFSMTRYIATLGVIFDRSRVSDYFGAADGTLQSPPMLLLPVWNDGGAQIVLQTKTPWAAAWARFRENVTPIDYVLAPGTAADNVLITGWQLRRPVRSSWRTILTRYDAVDVLVAEARLVRAWPGGPLRVYFVARHGPDSDLLGRFSLITGEEEGLDATLDAGVRRIDALYSAALQDGRLRAEVGLAVDLEPIIAPAPFIDGPLVAGQIADDAVINGAEILVSTPDSASLRSVETLFRRASGVTAVTATSLSLGGSSRFLVSHTGSEEDLRLALAAVGLLMTSENGAFVVRRMPGGPPQSISAPLAPAMTEPLASSRPGTSRPPEPRGAERLEAAPVDLLPRPSQ